ncbi:hypothetical protein N7510_004957 [Penicillium lagena]|uniref:uncharacterized protein n=1 Tax=Penicillium lagena TaxID=94218 RepID=UPI0025413DEA|nr:uncharacterized protein N7510_004957 [Penicillium lagena]KAJ5620973.1 hypothetical protein N7510_004957 [Penicillium lagena]
MCPGFDPSTYTLTSTRSTPALTGVNRNHRSSDRARPTSSPPSSSFTLPRMESPPQAILDSSRSWPFASIFPPSTNDVLLACIVMHRTSHLAPRQTGLIVLPWGT